MSNKRTLAAAVISALLAGCTQIDTGNVGVERTFGKVSPEVLTPGVYFTILKSVDEVTAKEVSFSLADMTPKSRDNLTMQDVDIDIYYKVAPQAVPGLYVKYQGDLIRHSQIAPNGTSDYVVAYSRVLREAREAVYKAIATMDATTMHTKRAELSEAIRATLQHELDSTDKGAFTVTAVNVRNLVTDKDIEAAIRQRAKTDQDIERKQKEIQLARAESERKKVEAEGDAAANRIVSASLTDSLLTLKIAEMQRDAAVAVAGKPGNTVLIGGGQQPSAMIGLPAGK